MAIKRMKQFFAEYGIIAIAVYWAIFFLVWFGIAGAIYLGFEVESGGAAAGTMVTAYLATKVTQPLRIAAALLLTPVIAKFFPGLVPKKLVGGDDDDTEAMEAHG